MGIPRKTEVSHERCHGKPRRTTLYLSEITPFVTQFTLKKKAQRRAADPASALRQKDDDDSIEDSEEVSLNSAEME